MTFNRTASALMVLLVVGAPTNGAGQDTASVSGTIADESGGVLPGVTVTATTSDTDGDTPPGAYCRERRSRAVRDRGSASGELSHASGAARLQ